MLLLCASALCGAVIPARFTWAADTSLFGNSPGTFIPFVTPIDSPASGLPKVNLSFGDGTTHTAVMDTGSVGLVVSRDIYNPTGPGLRPGSLVYNSSGIVENGNYYQTTFSFLDNDSKTVATTSLPVLVVDSISCLQNARHCTPSSTATGVSQMGVGFGQEAASQPDGIPSNNPFLNIASTATGVLPSKGYVIDRTGVTLGLQAGSLDGFSLVKLAPYPDKSTNAFPEWLLAPATVSVNGKAASGVILSDTGVTGMYLSAPTGATVSTFSSTSLGCGDSCAAPGTTVTVSVPGQAGRIAGYSFTVGPDGGKQAGNAQSPTFVSVDDPKAAPYVNATLNLFNNFDYLYDETDGFVGFRQRYESVFGSTSPGMTLQGSVSLPSSFVSNLPTYLMDYQQLMTVSGNTRTFLQQPGVPVRLDANGTATFNNALSGPGSLKIGSGIVTLAAANTYTGSTTVDAGATLALVQAGSIASSSGALVNGTFDISGTPSGATLASLSGSGQVQLGGRSLSVASGGAFSGVLGDSGLQGGNGGGLTLKGGMLALSGASTYTGPTNVNTGAILALSGTGSMSRSSVVTVDGTLDVSGTPGTSISALSGGGTVRLGGQTLTLSGNGRFSGVLTDGGVAGGSGGSVAVATGTQVLSGSSTYTGATTIAAGSTVALTGNGSLPQSRVSLAPGGLLDVSGADKAAVAALDGGGTVQLGARALILAGSGSSFTGNVTDGGLAGGSGGSVIVASGYHLLAGTNSYTGGTVVGTGATLAAASDAALGASGGALVLDGGTLRSNGDLIINRPMAATQNGALLDGGTTGMAISGPINGQGALSTAGTVRFNGTATVAGPLSLGGWTSINGSVAASDLVVQPGGTLRGTGQIIAPITVLGTLAPGNSPGTLLASGPVVLGPSSTAQFDIDGAGTGTGAGNYSRLVITGGSLTAGGTLLPQLRGITGSATNALVPSLGQQFTVVEATGGVLGSFARLSQPAGLAPGTRLDALYGPTTVTLVATPAYYGGLQAAGLPQSANQASLGAALDALRPDAGTRPSGPLATVLDAVYPLTATAIAPVLDGFGAKIYGDGLFAGLEQQRLVTGAVSDQMAARRGDAPSVRAQVDQASWGGTMWTQGLGAWTDLGRDGLTRGAGTTLSGVALGADVRLRGDVLTGLAVAYTGAATSARDGGSDDAQALHAIGYAGWQTGSLFVDALAGGTWTEDRYRRAQPVLNATARGQSGSSGVFGQAKAGVAFPLGNARVIPAMTFSGQMLDRRRTLEDGADSAALAVSSGGVRSLRSELGIRMDVPLAVAGRVMAATFHSGWSHEFADTMTATSASFLNLGGPGFVTSTAAFGRDGLRAGAGVTATIAPRIKLFAAYDADVRTRYAAQTVTGGLQAAW